jgi:hypothetical protein
LLSTVSAIALIVEKPIFRSGEGDGVGTPELIFWTQANRLDGTPTRPAFITEP